MSQKDDDHCSTRTNEMFKLDRFTALSGEVAFRCSYERMGSAFKSALIQRAEDPRMRSPQTL